MLTTSSNRGNFAGVMRLAITGITMVGLTGCSGSAQAPGSTVGQAGVPGFTIRPGYKVTLAADQLRNARFLESDGDSTIFLSRPQEGDIVSLRDADDDGFFETKKQFVKGRPTAHGMCFHKGWLWFTQSQAVHRARDTNGDGVADETETILDSDELPGGTGHWWRSILVTDSALYTSVGDSGNVTDERNTDRQKIWRYNLDGSGKKLFASGIRNTEKLRLRPGTREVWGADHGSDWFGGPLGERSAKSQPVTDRNPPCELNHYTEGGFYGHPFIVGDKLPRIEYQDRDDIIQLAESSISPEWKFGPHWAPNGFCFLTKDSLGPDHSGDAFAALHGSWNSTTPVGYRIERVLFDEISGKPYGALPIVQTLGANGQVLARPVDCVEMSDGTVLWSCDFTNKIYRISKSD